MNVKVWIVDDHAIVRRGMIALLELHDDIEVTGEADTGDSALDQLADVAPDERPDVLVVDLVMPGRDGVATTTAVRSLYPDVAVVILTSFTDLPRVRAALMAGAVAYILKTAGPDDVVSAILAAHAGRTHLDPGIARSLAQQSHSSPGSNTGLTAREREVLWLVGQGRSNRQIAGRLVITERTARTHVSNVLAKLGLASRTQAALWAVRHGFSSDDSDAEPPR